jgi:hypothetical protein
MNERIRELADLAKKKPLSNSWCYTNPAEFEQKFAEMIVKECLKEIKDMIVDESELLYPNNKQTTEFVNDRLLDAYDNIKEHFGVSE